MSTLSSVGLYVGQSCSFVEWLEVIYAEQGVYGGSTRDSDAMLGNLGESEQCGLELQILYRIPGLDTGTHYASAMVRSTYAVGLP